ncbi:MAG TPA: META domain-containing protein [Saprospiraceae bacterium]|nr:META domain-containing protein [Saprospiraceae bacterium]
MGSAVYFRANGTQPAWHLDIGEDQIAFTSSTTGFEQFLLPHAEPLRSETGNIKTYIVKSKEAEAEIQVFDQLCGNPNSNERFPYAVSVSIKRVNDKTPTIFSGCGLYVPDNRLHGRWTIESVKSFPILDSLFKEQQPYLELAVDKSYFTCFSGCNIINGRLYFERSLLRFTDLVTPKEPCDQFAIEKSVISALQFTTQFSILRGELILANPSETTMKLRKVK